MALRFDGSSGNYLSRSTSLPSQSAWTICGWVRITTDRNDYSSFFTRGNYPDTGWMFFGTTSDGVTPTLITNISSASGSACTVGTWYHVALCCSSTTINWYINGVSQTAVGKGSTVTTDQILLGADAWSTSEQLNGRLAHVKVWDGATLSQAEIINEMYSVTPVRFANLYSWIGPFDTSANGAKDLSGAGRDWTVNGTVTVEDGPPVSWGASPILVCQGAATSDITQALTGSASSSAAGTLAPSHSGGLSGQAATASAGTLAPSHSQALTGSAVSASAGTLIGSKAAAIAGQAATATAGTVSPAHAQALSGQAATAAAGTITYTAGVAAALTGQAATASAGTVGPEHAQALSGQAATAAAGTITYSGSTSVNVALSGQAATASAGTLAPSHSQALSGQAATASAGTVSYTSATLLEIALTGQSASASAGTITRSAAIAAAGQSVTAQAGTVNLAASRALTGQAASASAGALTYVPGISIALTGQTVTVNAGTMSRSVALLLAGSDIVIDAGTMTISGAEPVLRYAPDAHTIIGDARIRSAAAAERVRSATAASRVRTHIGDN